jgi:SpoVK/Ycf46/Vps4 family AAA+-type ATPase
VYFCSLADLESNSALIQCVSNMSSRAFLVLEDVDIVRSSHERSEEDGVTLDGLLNVLDGVLTPDGLITFMTTNEVDKLDPALIRPGRADRQFNLGFMTQDQLDKMICRFIPDHHTQIQLQRQDVVPAEIIECLKSSFDQPADFILNCIEEVVSEGYQSRYVRPKHPTELTASGDDQSEDEVPVPLTTSSFKGKLTR